MKINLGQRLHDKSFETPLQQFVDAVEENPRIGTLDESLDEILNYYLNSFEGEDRKLKEQVQFISDQVDIPESAKAVFLLRPKAARKPYSYIGYDEATDTCYYVDSMSRDGRAFEDFSDSGFDDVIGFGIAFMRYLINYIHSDSEVNVDDLSVPERHYS